MEGTFFYCVKCHVKREGFNHETVISPKGMKIYKANCSVCGMKMARLVCKATPGDYLAYSKNQ